jgi:hypothetical protein
MQDVAPKDHWPSLIWGVVTTVILLGVGIAPWLRFIVAP